MNRFRRPYSTTNNNYGNNCQFQTERKRAKRETIVIIINAILAILTLVAIIISNKATNIANESLSYAKGRDAVNDNKEKIETIDKSNKYSIDTAKTNKSIRISNQLAKASIQSLKDAQERFEIENQPFLQVSNIRFYQPVEGQRIKINFHIDNLKNIPVKLIEQSLVIITGEKKQKMVDFTPADIKPLNTYLIKETPFEKDLTLQLIPTKQDIENISTGKLIITFTVYVSVKYTNLVNKKRKRYNFSSIIKCLSSGLTFVDIMENENIDIN